MMVGVVSAKHAGVTTTAIALATAAVNVYDPLLVECDPAGGDLAAATGHPLDPGLLALAAAGRHTLDVETAVAHCQQLPTAVSVLMAPASSTPEPPASNGRPG